MLAPGYSFSLFHHRHKLRKGMPISLPGLLEYRGISDSVLSPGQLVQAQSWISWTREFQMAMQRMMAGSPGSKIHQNDAQFIAAP